jgi:transposase-like protein
MSIYAPQFTNENAAREHLEGIRWPDGPFCPHCGSFNAKRLPPVERKATKGHAATVRKGVVQCRDCREQYTVTVGTVFERSKVPLFKWLLATYLLTTSKKGISAHQIHRMLGVTYKTAWFMCHRIRTAMDQPSGPLGGSPDKIIEADETYVGGLTKNRINKNVARKKIMLSLVERGGHVRSFHIANVHGNIIRPLLFQHVDRLSSLATDEATVYTKAGEGFWQHQRSTTRRSTTRSPPKASAGTRTRSRISSRSSSAGSSASITTSAKPIWPAMRRNLTSATTIAPRRTQSAQTRRWRAFSASA